MTEVTITKNEVLDMLMAESTNAGRTYTRQDGASMFEDILIDEQAFDSMRPTWVEATAKLSEKMHEFLAGTTHSANDVKYTFKANTIPDDVSINVKMYIVDYMMAQWVGNIRPEMKPSWVERSVLELDDLLRKLYKKEPPV